MNLYTTYRANRQHNKFTFFYDEETHIPETGDSLIALDAKLASIDEQAKKLAGVSALEMQMELV